MQNGFMQKIIFIIGVSGCGKSTIGQLLAKEMNLHFIDADDYHPKENIEKMRQGRPLTDQDRATWLDQLHIIALDHLNTGCVIACSALKKIYRDRLSKSIEKDVLWIYLKGDYDQIFNRMQKRIGHFMNPDMLKSQFETLEQPDDAFDFNIKDPPDKIVKKIVTVIGVGRKL